MSIKTNTLDSPADSPTNFQSDRKHQLSIFSAVFRSCSGSAVSTSVDDKELVGEGGNQAVAHGESVFKGSCSGRVFGDYGTVRCQAVHQSGVFRRVTDVKAVRQDCNRVSVIFESCCLGIGVYAFCHTAYDTYSLFHSFPSQADGQVFA